MRIKDSTGVFVDTGALDTSIGNYIQSELAPHAVKQVAEQLWDMMYNKPVIIPCPWCAAHNAITNPCCIMCGGPMGA